MLVGLVGKVRLSLLSLTWWVDTAQRKSISHQLHQNIVYI